MNFPEKIKLTRNKLNETAEEFGKRFGVSTTAVSFWETGKREAPYEVLYFCEEVESKYKVCDKCKGKGYLLIQKQ